MTILGTLRETESLAADLLWGVEAIAAYIDRDERATYYGL
jgi:hypothetical protein